MTSNVGARQLKDFGQGVGFGTAARTANADDNSKSIIENAKKTFAPEFLNRIDDVIVFNTLEKHDIDLIIEIELKKLYARLTELYNNSFSEQKLYCRKGFDKQFGARPQKEPFRNTLKTHLLKRLLLKFLLETNFHGY
jgi:ATP-dependent Clp protease ATP-binding subunit ClpC